MKKTKKTKTQTVVLTLPSVEVEVPDSKCEVPRFGFTPEEAAATIGVSRATIYKLLKIGKLTPSRIFSSVRITPEEIQRFMRDSRSQRAS